MLCVAIIWGLLLSACQTDEETVRTGLQYMSTPCKIGGEPNLYADHAGVVYLSWVEYVDDSTDALMFSTLEKGEWSEATRITSGTDWFVNWADFPSLAVYSDDRQHLAAHWLQESGRGVYDYDVRVAQSIDGGRIWQVPFTPHTDGIAAEHGFVSLLPLGDGRMFATWLDGRYSKIDYSDEGHLAHGAMTLRCVTFDINGKLSEEAELDDRVCDCCQTSAALTSHGPVVAYRDRSDEEIRDISVVRYAQGAWSAPVRVHADNWQTSACPVNGPSVVARSDTVAVAWFTRATGLGEVHVAFSSDSGATFMDPVKVHDENAIGRVDLVLLENGNVIVSWIETVGDSAELRVAEVGWNGKVRESRSIVQMTSSRQSGFPVMARSGNRLVFAWTDVDSTLRVSSALLQL